MLCSQVLGAGIELNPVAEYPLVSVYRIATEACLNTSMQHKLGSSSALALSRVIYFCVVVNKEKYSILFILMSLSFFQRKLQFAEDQMSAAKKRRLESEVRRIRQLHHHNQEFQVGNTLMTSTVLAGFSKLM